MKKKTEYSETIDAAFWYPNNLSSPFIYKDTDSIRVMESEIESHIERITPEPLKA